MNTAHEHSKEEWYEMYSIQKHKADTLEENLKRCEKALAGERYERDMYLEKWLRLHIEKHVKVEGDMEEALDYYFDHPWHKVFFTPSGGYYCLVEENDHLFIVFAWTNPDEWAQERKDMPTLIKSLYNAAHLPIRYTGVNNIMKNHSVEIEPGLWELRL